MRYVCGECRRAFTFEEDASYCPFCGANRLFFSDSTAFERIPAPVATTLWEDVVKIKSEFSDIISNCIGQINSIALGSIGTLRLKPDLSAVDTSYSKIKGSSNRKILIDRINSCLNNINLALNEVNHQSLEDASNAMVVIVETVTSMTCELYSILDIQDTPSNAGPSPTEFFSVKMNHTGEQLQDLYSLVLEAYGKYKKCVECNNMFAAFSSTSDYGMLSDCWLRPLYESFNTELENAPPEPQIEDVISFMKSQNKKKYLGFFDEDFSPHVDAFWFGLDMLLNFLRNYASLECDLTRLEIGDAEKITLLHAIDLKKYELTEDKFKAALELQQKISAKCVEIISKR